MLSTSLLAQTSDKQWRFNHLSVNEGLPHSDTRAVIQDKEGFLWIGTGKGLSKYDGYAFENFFYEVDNPSSISSSRILSLYSDDIDNLWIGTLNRGLSVYDKRHNFSYRIHQQGLLPEAHRPNFRLQDAAINCITSDNQDNIYLGTRKYGLIKVHRNREGQVTRLEPLSLNGHHQHEIMSLSKDRRNNIWILTHTQGVFIYNPRQGKSKRVRLRAKIPTDNPYTIYLDHEDNLWISSESALGCVPTMLLAFSKIPKGLFG